MLKDWIELCRLFNDKGVDYLLVGGQAVIAHGYPRLTKDLDLWVRPSRGNGLLVLEALKEFGAPSSKALARCWCLDGSPSASTSSRPSAASSSLKRGLDETASHWRVSRFRSSPRPTSSPTSRPSVAFKTWQTSRLSKPWTDRPSNEEHSQQGWRHCFQSAGDHDFAWAHGPGVPLDQTSPCHPGLRLVRYGAECAS